MMVSIVIPCFNAAPFIGEAVASACAQADASVEVIVVDDGSTDGSGAIAARWAGVRVIRQRNAGLSCARNTGFAASRGEVVIFLDADDRLQPTAAQTAVEAFARDPEAAMVFGRCRLIAEDGTALPTPLSDIRRDFYAELLRHNFIWMPAMAAFRRRVIAECGGFDPRVSPSADYDLYLRIARRHRIAAHDRVVADYRQRRASMSSDPVLMLTTTLAVLRGQRAAIAGDRRLVRICSEGTQRWRWFYGERLVERFRAQLRERRFLSAVRDGWALLRLYPSGVRHHLRKKAALVRGATW